jgi:hypothetical protein
LVQGRLGLRVWSKLPFPSDAALMPARGCAACKPFPAVKVRHAPRDRVSRTLLAKEGKSSRKNAGTATDRGVRAGQNQTVFSPAARAARRASHPWRPTFAMLSLTLVLSWNAPS